MEARIEAEFELLRSAYRAVVYKDDWILICDYRLPPGWSQAAADVATFLRPGYPGTHPYGIYVREGLLFEGQPPKNFTCPARPMPPFDGTWGVLSWQPEKGQWKPASDPVKGHNILTWVSGFIRRFKEGC